MTCISKRRKSPMASLVCTWSYVDRERDDENPRETDAAKQSVSVTTTNLVDEQASGGSEEEVQGC